MKIIYILIIAFSLIWVSCKKPVKYSEIPDIKFLSIPIKDTIDKLQNPVKRATLTYYLIDGNGDIGYKDGDTLPPYDTSSIHYNNLFIEMYELKDGIYSLVDLALPFNFRTSYIEPIGQNKTIKCTIYADIDVLSPPNWDSVRFDFYMYDRALNKSNIETTGLVVY